MINTLEEKHDETIIAYAMVDETTMLEVYSSETNNTWSVVLTMLFYNGYKKSCIIQAGRNWVNLDPIIKESVISLP